MSPRALATRLAPSLVAAWPAAALACSGPGAPAAIARADRIGWALLAGTALLVAATHFAARRPPSTRRLIVALLVHPGWWLGARGGDCGRMRVAASIAATVLFVLAAAFLLWRARRSVRPQ